MSGKCEKLLNKIVSELKEAKKCATVSLVLEDELEEKVAAPEKKVAVVKSEQKKIPASYKKEKK